jgi:hypothetical protein
MSIQNFNKSISDIQPYHVYYDMNIINNDSSFPAEPVRFQYKETRSNYFLLSPQDYFMSIVRFNLQSPTLPVFIPQINLNSNNNDGGRYPIQSMIGTSNQTNFVINLYTPTPFDNGVVVFLALTNPTNSVVYETSGVQDNYYRVIASNQTTANSNITTMVLLNANASLNGSGAGNGVPNNYASSAGTGSPTTFNQRAGTIQIEYANIFLNNITYNTSTNQMTLFAILTPALTSLQDVYAVGDEIFLIQAGQYNGRYTILGFPSSSQVLVSFAQLRQKFFTLINGVYVNTGGLSDYVGGVFTSAGDFYNITPYTITLSYTNSGTTYSYTEPITYIPNDLSIQPPIWNPSNAQALSLADLTSQYYWIYNYEVWINLVNQTLVNCFWGLSGAFYGGTGGFLPMTGSTITTYQPPSMSWSTDTLKAIITADNNAFRQTIGNPIYMFFNQPMATLFNSFPYEYPNVSPSSDNFAYVVFLTSAGAGLYIVSTYSSVGVVTPQFTAIQVYQDHQTASLMNPVQSISFTSTLLPVTMENVGAPLILNGSAPNNLITVGSTANVFPIVTDFIVPFSATNNYVPDITYVPSGEYRLVDLYGTSPCNQIDIQVFWRDVYGLLHPFFLGSGCSGSLKIMFRKKIYNNAPTDYEL